MFDNDIGTIADHDTNSKFCNNFEINSPHNNNLLSIISNNESSLQQDIHNDLLIYIVYEFISQKTCLPSNHK